MLRNLFEVRTKRIAGFSLIESVAMLVAIAVFSWICLGVLKLKKLWPFDKAVAIKVTEKQERNGSDLLQ